MRVPNRPSPNRIAYLSLARLPTEKANGYQTMKMCEALARLGLEVELYHPRRFQADPALRDVDPFDYYSIEPIFRIRTLPGLDPMYRGRRLPSAVLSAANVSHRVAWAGLAAGKAV